MRPTHLIVTELASVALYDDARRLLRLAGYGAVRADGDNLDVYELNPGETFATALEKNGGIPRAAFQGFNSLYVKPAFRGGHQDAPKEGTDDHPVFKFVARLRVDEGSFEDVMGEENSYVSNPSWAEVVDATDLYALLARRVDPSYRPPDSGFIGRGRSKTERNAGYFSLFSLHRPLLDKFGIRLYRRVGGFNHPFDVPTASELTKGTVVFLTGTADSGWPTEQRVEIADGNDIVFESGLRFTGTTEDCSRMRGPDGREYHWAGRVNGHPHLKWVDADV